MKSLFSKFVVASAVLVLVQTTMAGSARSVKIEGKGLQIFIQDDSGDEIMKFVPEYKVNNKYGNSYTYEQLTELAVGDQGVTIYDLQRLSSVKGGAAILDDLLINYGVNVKCVPQGYSAGMGAAVFKGVTGGENDDDRLTTKILGFIVGKAWRGKLFGYKEDQTKCKPSTAGLNRIDRYDQAAFVSYITPAEVLNRQFKFEEGLSGHINFSKIRSNTIELNYAKAADSPRGRFTKGISKAVQEYGVFDVTVCVPGRYGCVLNGITYPGSYSNLPGEEAGQADLRRVFTSRRAQLIARFFLDFSNQALVDQQMRDHRTRCLTNSKNLDAAKGLKTDSVEAIEKQFCKDRKKIAKRKARRGAE